VVIFQRAASEANGNHSRRDSALSAAAALQSDLQRVFPHDAPVLGATLRDASSLGMPLSAYDTKILAWTKDGMLTLWTPSSQVPLHRWHHTGAIVGACFVPGGNEVVSWTSDGIAYIWDTASGNRIRQITLDGQVLASKTSSDGVMLYTCNETGVAHLWNTGVGGEPRTVRHGGPISHAHFTRSDPPLVVTMSGAGRIEVWDLQTAQIEGGWNYDPLKSRIAFLAGESSALHWSGAPLRLVDCKDGLVQNSYDIQKSPASVYSSNFGDRFVTCDLSGAFQLWETGTSSLIRQWKHSTSVHGAHFSGDRELVATWSLDGAIRVWRVSEEAPIRVWKHEAAVNGAEFTNDLTGLLTWSDDGTVRLWSCVNQKPDRSWDHVQWIDGAQLLADESKVLTWGSYEARLWDGVSGQLIGFFSHGGKRVLQGDISDSGKRVVICTDSAGVWVWDAVGREAIRSWPERSDVWSAHFLKDESEVLLFGARSAELWNVTANVMKQEWSDVVDVRWSNDNVATIASVSKSGRLLVWESDKELPLADWEEAGAIDDACISSDGTTVVTWSHGGRIAARKIGSEASASEWRVGCEVQRAGCSSDGSRIVFFGNGVNAGVCDINLERPSHFWSLDGAAAQAKFDTDGRRLLTVGANSAVTLWDCQERSRVRTWMHGSQIKGVLFSRLGDHVISWCNDGSTFLWDVNEDAPLRTWRHEQAVNGAQLSPDGTRLFTWCEDGVMRLWPTSLGSGDAVADRRRAAESLTGMTIDDELRRRMLTFDEWRSACQQSSTGKN